MIDDVSLEIMPKLGSQRLKRRLSSHVHTALETKPGRHNGQQTIYTLSAPFFPIMMDGTYGIRAFLSVPAPCEPQGWHTAPVRICRAVPFLHQQPLHAML